MSTSDLNERPHSRQWPAALRGALISVLFVLPAVVGVRADTEDLNRTVREFPVWRASGLLEPEYSRQVGRALADRLGLRRAARRTNAEFALRLRDDPSPRVRRGVSDDWFFFSETIDLMSTFGQDPRRRRRAVMQLQRRIVDGGRDFRMLVAPAKATIYPDQLSAEDRRRWRADVEPKIDRFERFIRQRPVPGFLALTEPMRAAARDQLLYEPLGTHWLDAGAAVATRALVESYDPELWRRGRIVSLGGRDIESDLLPLAGIKRSANLEALSAAVPGYSSERVRSHWTGRGFIRVHESTAMEGSAPARDQLLPPTCLFRDSFGTRMIGVTAPFFSKIAFIDYSSVGSPQAETLFAECEVAVFLISERHFFPRTPHSPMHHWSRLRPLLDAAVTARQAESAL